MTGTPQLPSSMRAAVYHGRRDVRIEWVPVPSPSEDEVLLSVCAVGICGTDASEYDHGPAMFPIDTPHPVTGHSGPMIIGHEFAGTVAQVGPGVDASYRGRLATSTGAVSCGACWQCRRGRPNLCESYTAVGLHRDGALAQYVTTPLANCAFVDGHGLTGDAAALGQPMSIAVHAARRSRVGRGERAAVIGAGGIGSFLIHVLSKWGVQTAVCEADASRLDLARRLGAHGTVHVERDADVAQAVQATLGERPTVVFEVTGSRSGLRSALSLVPPGGRLVLVGIQQGEAPIDVRRTTLSEFELIGTNAMVTHEDLPEAIDLLKEGGGIWSEVAPNALSLDDLVEKGLRPMADGRADVVKMLVDPWSEGSRTTRFA